MESYQIGIDVGGTFTDLVAAGGPEPVYLKVPTPADDQALGVHAGLERLAARLGLDRSQLLARTHRIVHGTTVATNMMIEGTGSRVGLLTTAGFRDELEYRRGLKETIYDPRLPAPRPFTPAIASPARPSSRNRTRPSSCIPAGSASQMRATSTG